MKYLRVILIVLLLGCCTLWVTSYWWMTWHSPDIHFMCQIRHGYYFVQIYEPTGLNFNYGGTGVRYGLTLNEPDDLDTFWWPVLWISMGQKPWFIHGTLWLPTLLLALLVAVSESPWSRRRRRAKQGLCIRCGYDLSGTEHEACPECGS